MFCGETSYRAYVFKQFRIKICLIFKSSFTFIRSMLPLGIFIQNAVKVSVQAMLSNPSVETDSNCEGQSTDFDSRPLIIAEPVYAKIAHNTELVYNAVPSSDQSLTLISSVGGDDGNSPEIEATFVPSFIPGTYSSEKDIIVLRNMDHNYFSKKSPASFICFIALLLLLLKFLHILG